MVALIVLQFVSVTLKTVTDVVQGERTSLHLKRIIARNTSGQQAMSTTAVHIQVTNQNLSLYSVRHALSLDARFGKTPPKISFNREKWKEPQEEDQRRDPSLYYNMWMRYSCVHWRCFIIVCLRPLLVYDAFGIKAALFLTRKHLSDSEYSATLQIIMLFLSINRISYSLHLQTHEIIRYNSLPVKLFLHKSASVCTVSALTSPSLKLFFGRTEGLLGACMIPRVWARLTMFQPQIKHTTDIVPSSPCDIIQHLFTGYNVVETLSNVNLRSFEV